MILPVFRPKRKHRQWIQYERKTAVFIRTFWAAASARQRVTPGFLWFLTASAWTNIRSDGSGEESTREWRNRILADYLGVDYQTISSLAKAVRQAFPSFTPLRARKLLATHTGITRHYPAIRPSTHRYVLRHARELCDLFTTVSSSKHPPEDKIRRVAVELAGMPLILTPRGGRMSPFNPLSPVLACLDPHRRFPIMNQRTHRLLRAIGKEHDGDGAIALCNLIGSHGIRDSFELDVYSQAAKENFPAARRRRIVDRPGVKDISRVLPIKSEMDSLARLAARRVRIRKEHNKLTNRFRRAVFADVTPQERNFDLLIDGWKRDRKLLIEAKTDWRGPTGRMQIRQAIGQLFDYRLQYFAEDVASVDLAVLVPTEPSTEIKELLASLRIAVLWFCGCRLCGTVRLQE